jgi:hypothetical protein
MTVIHCPQCGQPYRTDASPDSPVTVQTSCIRCGAAVMLPASAGPPQGNDSTSTPEAAVEGVASEAAPEDGPPWERRRAFWDLPAYWQTARAILFHPAASFRRWRLRIDTESALLILLLYGSLGEILADYWVRLGQGLLGRAPAAPGQLLDFVLFMLKVPLLLLLSTVVMSGVIHALLILLGARGEPWKKTFALLAYLSGALAALQLLPFLGVLLAPFWGMAACVVGLRELHGTTTWRVVLSLLLPLLLLLLLGGVILLVVLGVGLLAVQKLAMP